MFEKNDFSLGHLEKHSTGRKDLKLSSFYSPSPIEDFIHSSHKAPHSAHSSIRITSDIYMLFNQQRLDRMTLQNLAAHISTMAPRDASLSSLKSRLSDEQLASLVKSRFIQSTSEMLAYSKYLNNMTDAELSAYVAARQQQLSDQNNEPTPAPAPVTE